MLEDTGRCRIVRKNVKRRGPGRPGKDRPHGALLLLKAGQSAFARHGFEGASLRGIAAAAGVDPALAAHHFGSKEALWEAIFIWLPMSLNCANCRRKGKFRSERVLRPRFGKI